MTRPVGGADPPCEQATTVVGQVFGALEPDEEALVADHLAECDACRAVRDDAEAVAAAIGRSVPQVDPPPELRHRVLAAAASEPDPPRRAAPSAALEPGSPGSPDGPPIRDDADLHATGRRGRTAFLALALAATVGVVLLVVGAIVPTESGPNGSQDTTTQAARAQRIVDGAATREPGVRHATLRSGDGEPFAVVLDEPAGARVVPVAMPEPGQGNRYILWAATSGAAAVPVATVDPTAGTTVPLPGAAPPSTPRAFAVSVEPTGPVPARPSSVVGVGVVA